MTVLLCYMWLFLLRKEVLQSLMEIKIETGNYFCSLNLEQNVQIISGKANGIEGETHTTLMRSIILA